MEKPTAYSLKPELVMRVSLNWLNEYVKIDDLDPEALAERLDLTGTAVEGVEEQGKGLEKILVGQILKIRSHPQADKLTLCHTTIGTKTLQIVCGAKNMKEGDKVPVALIGAVLPGGMEIKKTVIRGQESQGMLCSEAELQLGEDASGLMILPQNLKVGEPLAKALGLDDTILELEITPNRPDCLGMIGIAREVGAVLGRSYEIPQIKINEESKKAAELAKIEIKVPNLCPHYTAKVITDLTVAESPQWMKKRLIAAGARPLNNIVDMTNYILFETSQPLHAFDYELMGEGTIIVRQAKKGEKMVTLDEVERTLDEDNLVIADPSGPIALAGVMGGASTEVSNDTKVVLLESAYFDPRNITRTSRTLGLISESSMRFEKGIDPNGCIYAANRAAQLMQELAGGRVLKGTIDEYPKKLTPVDIKLRPKRVNFVLGTNILDKQMINILKSLDLDISQANSQLKVKVPTFRPDLEREIDLIEEVARIFGLNNIKATLPESSGKFGALNYEQEVEGQIREIMISSGLKEAVTYSFLNPQLVKKMSLPDPLDKMVEIANPITEDQQVLRTTLLPGLLLSLRHNVNRGQLNVRLFEMGKVFLKKAKGLAQEPKRLAAIVSSKWHEAEWFEKEKQFDFFDLKGILEVSFEKLRISSWDFLPDKFPFFRSGNSATVIVDSDSAGFVGEIDPSIISAFELPNPAFFFELDLGILTRRSTKEVSFSGVPRFPGITLDVAVLIDESIPNKEVLRVIKEAGGDLLKAVRLFDLYTGKGIPADKKSLAYSLLYQHFGRTLKMEEAQSQHAQVTDALKKELGAEIR